MCNIRHTAEQKNNVIALYKAGTSMAEISWETGVPQGSIHYMIRHGGVALRRHSEQYGKHVQKSAIIALYTAGFNREKIEDTLHVSSTAIGKSIHEFREENPEYDTPQVLARLERDKNICELRNSGKTYRAIGEIVGMSEAGVYHVCSKYGITASAKRARKDNGEIPQEILAPLVEYMRKFISAEFAEKVENLAKNMVA